MILRRSNGQAPLRRRLTPSGLPRPPTSFWYLAMVGREPIRGQIITTEHPVPLSCSRSLIRATIMPLKSTNIWIQTIQARTPAASARPMARLRWQISPHGCAPTVSAGSLVNSLERTMAPAWQPSTTRSPTSKTIATSTSAGHGGLPVLGGVTTCTPSSPPTPAMLRSCLFLVSICRRS